jgi:hypothetical protein
MRGAAALHSNSTGKRSVQFPLPAPFVRAISSPKIYFAMNKAAPQSGFARALTRNAPPVQRAQLGLLRAFIYLLLLIKKIVLSTTGLHGTFGAFVRLYNKQIDRLHGCQ